MDDFQLYKLAHLEVYSISEVAKMEIVGNPNNDSNLNRFSLANMKGHMLFQDGRALTEEELMERGWSEAEAEAEGPTEAAAGFRCREWKFLPRDGGAVEATPSRRG